MLDAILDSPLFRPAPPGLTIGTVRQYQLKSTKASPEAVALRFYVSTEFLMRARWLRDQGRLKMTPEIRQALLTCHTDLMDCCGLMFLYMVMIIGREIRHTHDKDSMLTNMNVQHRLKKSGLSGTKKWFVKYMKDANGLGSSGVANALFGGSQWEDMNEYRLLSWVAQIEAVFYHGGFSGGFGGKPWANIADTLLKYLTGEINLHAMVDTCYTLCHNNGPIFNKGYMFGSYTGEFQAVLDVQRVGMVGRWLGDQAWDRPKALRELYANALSTVGDYPWEAAPNWTGIYSSKSPTIHGSVKGWADQQLASYLNAGDGALQIKGLFAESGATVSDFEKYSNLPGYQKAKIISALTVGTFEVAPPTTATVKGDMPPSAGHKSQGTVKVGTHLYDTIKLPRVVAA